MRLIDSHALIKRINCYPKDIRDSAINAISHTPTVKEAAVVVRCKDCKFYTEEERWCRRLGLCGAFEPSGYCSHAEQKGANNQ